MPSANERGASKRAYLVLRAASEARAHVVSKKTFVIFGLLVVFLAVLIPWLAFRADRDASRGAQ